MLTKKQRLEAYTYAYISVLSDCFLDFGVCHILDLWGIRNTGGWLGSNHIPEWYNQEPKGASPFDFWWPIENRRIRLRALERAIAECEAAES